MESSPLLAHFVDSMELEISFLVTILAIFMIHHAYKRERKFAALTASYTRHEAHLRKSAKSYSLYDRPHASKGGSDAVSVGTGSTRTGTSSSHRELFASYRENQDLILAAFENSYGEAIELMREWAAAGKALSPTNISTFMHRCSKSRKECPADLLVYMTEQAENTQLPFASRAIASTLYGLRSCTDSDELQDFLRVITKHLDATEGTIEAHEIGQFLYGLHSVGPTPNVRALMMCVVDKMHNGQFTTLDGQAVGNAIYGLRKCGGCDEFKQVLEAFTMHLRRQPDIAMIGQNYANALYGLHKASDSPELRHFVHELAYRLAASNVPLGPQEIGQACSGLVGMRDCEPVRILLGALATRIEEKNLILDAQSVGNTLCGLARCGGSAEAAALVSALAARISARQDKYGCHMVANAMVGLQKVPDSAEKRLIVGELANRMTEASPTASQIAQCLYGLQNMTDCPEARAFLRAYAPKIDMSHATMSADELAHALYGLNSCGQSAEARQALHVLQFKVQRGEKWTEPAPIEMAAEGLIGCGANWETIQILVKLLDKIPHEAEGKLMDLRREVEELLALAREECPHVSVNKRMDASARLGVAETSKIAKPKTSVQFAGDELEHSEEGEQTSSVYGLRAGKSFSTMGRSSAFSSTSGRSWSYAASRPSTAVSTACSTSASIADCEFETSHEEQAQLVSPADGEKNAFRRSRTRTRSRNHNRW